MNMATNLVCQICGAALYDQAERLTQVCSASRCQLAWVSRLQARRNAELQLQRQQRTGLAVAYRDREAARLGIVGAEKLLPVPVPANLRKVGNLPERRKRAFRDYLTGLISQAAALRAKSAECPPGDTASDSLPLASELAAQLSRGCATCRGRCCAGGGDHAYLTVDTILGYMRDHPKQRPRAVLEAYLRRLPNRAYEDSCVYQTEQGCALPREMRARISGDFFCEDLQGCALPREMRARISGDFFCEDLRDFQKQYYGQGEQSVVFFAFEGREIVRAEPVPIDP
jgi:hypothetical protein